MADIVTVCIASSKAPLEGHAVAFLEALHKAIRGSGCELVAYLGREGRGCYNHGMKIKGERCEIIISSLTISLGPCSRWSYVTDEFEGFVFEDLKK